MEVTDNYGDETLYELQGFWEISSDSVNKLVEAYNRLTIRIYNRKMTPFYNPIRYKL